MADMTLLFAHTAELANRLLDEAETAREESRKQLALADHLERTAARIRIAIKNDERNTQGKPADER